jgi:hypothetical protein
MNGIQVDSRDSRGGMTGGKASCGPDDAREVKMNRGGAAREYQDENMNRIAECVSILLGTTRGILEYLKKQPGAEYMVAMSNSAIQRAEQVLKNRCMEWETSKTGLCEGKEDSRYNKPALSSPGGDSQETNWVDNPSPQMKGFCSNVTSGSIIVEDQHSTQVLVSVKNSTAITQTIRVRVLRDDLCPAMVLAEKSLMVSGYCSNAITVPFNNASAYEIEVYGLAPGMTVSSVELDICRRLIKCSRLTASQFVCLVEKSPLCQMGRLV